MTPPALEGRRVLVTRAAHQAGKLSDGLRLLGAEPVEVPVLEMQPPASFEGLDGALAGLRQFDWLIFTSANAVLSLVARALSSGVSLLPAADLEVAAVGPATAAAARNAGFSVTFVPEAYVAERMAEGLSRQVAGRRVLLVRAAVARDIVPDALRAVGASVEVVDAYSNGMPATAPALLEEAFRRGIDAATFTSSSSVTHLAEAARSASMTWPLSGVAAVSIGPITSRTLRESGWEPAIEASVSDIPGLLAAVAALFAKSES